MTASRPLRQTQHPRTTMPQPHQRMMMPQHRQLPNCTNSAMALPADSRTVRFCSPPPNTLKQLMMVNRKYKYYTTPPTPVVKRRTPRRVRFAPTATVVPGGYITSEECRKQWYRNRDYAAFDKERRDTIQAVSAVKGDFKTLDPETYCLRGLEQHLTSKRQLVERRFYSMKCKEAVFKHQYYQKQGGVSDPDSLGRASQMYSLQSSKRAYMRAVIEHALAA